MKPHHVIDLVCGTGGGGPMAVSNSKAKGCTLKPTPGLGYNYRSTAPRKVGLGKTCPEKAARSSTANRCARGPAIVIVIVIVIVDVIASVIVAALVNGNDTVEVIDAVDIKDRLA